MQVWNTSSTYSYTIYTNATIIYNNNGKKEKQKITDDELNKLIELANKVENKYHKKPQELVMFDAGTSTKTIYNQKLNKWITLEMISDTERGYNNSAITNELLNFVNSLEKKYFN